MADRNLKLYINRFFSYPPRFLLVAYIIVITVGSLILYLPISTTKHINFVDAVFTTTSAITDTGLIVLDTQKDFSLFGKFVILILIQVGGLGYMGMSTFFMLTLGRKVSYRDRLILAESLSFPGVGGLIKFLKRVFTFIAVIEITGCAVLFISMYDGNILKTLWRSIFHSISAFNNAGFSLFSENLIAYRSNFLVNFTIALLIFLGGIGFYVMNEFYLLYKKELNRLSTHSRMVIYTSLYLIFFGAAAILLFEYQNTRGLWQFDWWERISASLFTSVSSRTAGFNTFDLSGLTDATLTLISGLMFIGASPGSTGGGIRTVTFTIIFLTIINYINGRKDVNFYYRKINNEQIHRTLVIFSLSFTFITLVALFLSKLEKITFTQSLFETISAFATVGLSVGNGDTLSLCANFTTLGKIIIMSTMVIGKIGLLSFMMAIVAKKESRIKTPEARILI